MGELSEVNRALIERLEVNILEMDGIIRGSLSSVPYTANDIRSILARVISETKEALAARTEGPHPESGGLKQSELTDLGDAITAYKARCDEMDRASPPPKGAGDREIIDDLMQSFADPYVNKLTARAALEIARLDALVASPPKGAGDAQARAERAEQALMRAYRALCSTNNHEHSRILDARDVLVSVLWPSSAAPALQEQGEKADG